MSELFKVGEVLVGQNITASPQYNGCECIVLQYIPNGTFFCQTTKAAVFTSAYKVQWSDGLVINVWPTHLRRKQPPAGEQSIMDMFKLPAPRKAKEAA